MSDVERALEAIAPTVREMNGYILEHIRHHRKHPGEGLTSKLLEAEVDGVGMADQEIVGFVALLLVAGHITTTALLGNAVLSFDQYPEAAALMRADPGRLPDAIEEVLRWLPPFPELGRRTTREVELGGRTLPADSILMANLASANRDPARFADPGTFQVRRNPNPHLTFGHGIHFCFGAPWPGWRRASRCANCWTASPASPSRTAARSSSRTRPSSSARAVCRWRCGGHNAVRTGGRARLHGPGAREEIGRRVPSAIRPRGWFAHAVSALVSR